jgi:hypothetical protein
MEDGSKVNKIIVNIVYRTSIIVFLFHLFLYLNTTYAKTAAPNNENMIVRFVDVVDLGSVCGTYNKIIGNNAVHRTTRAINMLNPNITLSFGVFMG